MLATPSLPARHRRSRRRRGVILLESALVYSVTLMLLLGTIVMSLGIFQYQQVAALAREGSRWASVHGPTYQSEQGASAITSTSVLQNAIYPKVIILNTANLSCNLSMSSGRATVTINYVWVPEAYFASISMSSTSVTPILY